MSTSEYQNAPRTAESALSVDPEEVQRAKREIQAIVQQIAELSRSDIASEQFYDQFLNKVVSALAAMGGAVWTLGTGGLQLNYQINLRSTGLLENPIGQAQHGRLLLQSINSREGLLVAPHSGHAGGSDQEDEQAAANPTDYLLVLMPVFNDQGPQGVVEVFQRPGARPATQRGYLKFLEQTCELAGDYLRARRLRHLAEKQSLWEQLESFTRTAHETLDLRECAYAIANEGRRLIGCDRVSVAIRRGSRVVVESVSGKDTFDKRSNVVTLLNRLATAVTKTGEDVWYDGDTSKMAPQVEHAIDAYVDESQTKSMAILPLFRPSRDEEEGQANQPKKRELLGALIVEQTVDTSPSEGYVQRVDVVRSHSATALANALEHNSLFLMPLWKLLGKTTSLFRGSTRWKTLAVLGVLVAIGLFATFVKIDFNLEGKGRLKPVTLRGVFAQVDGEILEIPVAYDSEVTQGAELLKLRSYELQDQMAQLTGQAEGTQTRLLALSRQSREELSNADRIEIDGEIARLRIESRTIAQQLETLQKMLDLLTVRSPIDGRVITGKHQIEQLGSRPVSRGQMLLEVADLTGDWYLEVLMPESRMRFVSQAWYEANEKGEPLPVTFILAGIPDTNFYGTVELVESTAEARGDEGNTVLIRVKLDPNELARLRGVIGGGGPKDPKVGAEAIAKVTCGKAPAGYVYLHDLFDFVQAKVLFRLW